MKDVREILVANEDEVEINLGERSTEIDTKTQATELREVVKAIKDTMRSNNIKSLSAPAIGVKRRIFCIDYSDLEIKTYINPVIVEAKGLELSIETCTSIPGKKYMRPRNNDLTIMYQTPTGKIETRRLVGLAAIVFQHEMDHIDGILLKDIGVELPETYNDFTEAEKTDFVNDYLDSLDLLSKELETEIKTDDDLKKIEDATEFMTKVYKGEVKLDASPE